MKKIMAAYWHKDGLDIYSYAGQVPFQYASGTLESIEPIKRGWGIKALIVGKDRLMHVRKRYPPAPLEKLTKAVALEIGEIFPISQPAFYCRIFKSISNYVELDIWAWETDAYEKLKAVFPFSHVIPEDVLFTASEPEVRIFQQRDLIHMVAHTRGGFLDSASVPLADFDYEQINRFLLNLSQTGEEIKKISIYGLRQIQIKNIPGLQMVRNEEKTYPPCVATMAQIDLREFKIRGEQSFLSHLPLAMRLCLYLAAGYAFMLFLTVTNYDRAATEIRQKIAAMDKTTTGLEAAKPAMDYSDVVQEINAKLQKSPAPVKIMNMLAQKLPEGSYINRIIFGENNLELNVASKNPLALVKALSSGDGVQKVTIKGTLSRDKRTGFYTCTVIMELLAK